MSELMLSNREAQILSQLRTALEEATVDAAPVFARVEMRLSDDQSAGWDLRGPVPFAAVLCETSRITSLPGGRRAGRLACTLLLADRKPPSPSDQSAGIDGILSLRESALRAVESAELPATSAWGDERRYVPRLSWGGSSLTHRAGDGWIVCRLGVHLGFLLDRETT